MCWISKKQDIKIAEQDIPIFKIMETYSPNLVRSYFRDYLYTLNVLVESEIVIRFRNDAIVVGKALHSYSEKMKTKLFDGIFSNLHVYDKEGYYVAKYTIYYNQLVLVKGTIPKGSQYMENERGEFVSNQLILTEICAGLEN